MNTQDAIAVLRQHADALRARGVRHAALFGSVARGSAGPDSDIDIMIELDPARHIDVFTYAELKQHIEGLFAAPVDVVNRDGLKPHLRDPVIASAVYAF
jgi:uncharacterized protein